MLTLLLNLLKSSWPYIAAFFGAVAVGFGMAWQIQGLRLDDLENEFSAYKNSVEQQAIEARRAAMDKEQFWRQEVENARINAQAREAALRRDVAAAQSAAGGLRNDLAAARTQLSAASVETCRSYAGTLDGVLAECSERYITVAGIADQCTSDLQTVSEAWPK